MKIPKYVMLKPGARLGYRANLKFGNVYKVSGLDRRDPEQDALLCVFNEEDGVSVVGLHDVIEVPYETYKLSKVLFS